MTGCGEVCRHVVGVICGPGVLVLLRHGQSSSNAAREFTGWLDSPLTALGRCRV